MTIENQQLIAGRFEASGKSTFAAMDAASGAHLAPEFADATRDEITAACQAAESAAENYRARTLEERAAFLEAIASELEASAEAFVERTCAETGLPEARIRGELGRTTGQLRLFAGVVRAGDFLGVRIDHGDPERQPAPKPDLRQYRIPLGPVAVFGASNFPLAFSVCGGDTASALGAGCPVVVKAHPGHPGTSALAAAAVARAVQASGMPAGVFSMLHGQANEVGAALVQNPAIKAVGFTGSQGGGLALVRLAAAREEPIPVYAEMGSVNPMFLLPEAVRARGDSIAKGLAGSFTLGSGQFCTSPGLIFMQSGKDLEDFVQTFGEAVSETAASVMLHGGILSAYEDGRDRLAEAEGVELIAAGAEAEGRARPAAYRVTIEHFEKNPALAEEIFGPTTLIVEVDDVRRFAEIAGSLPGQLTAGIHGEEAEIGDHGPLIEILQQRAGRVLFNGFPTGVEVGHAMVHGGPYPATSDGRTTSVGTLAIDRFLRPVCLQDAPATALPEAVQESNPLGLRRLVDGTWQGPAN
jgi:NADP-dependent aldehyde dehydrogenase